MRVAVLMSGGVDSSVALVRLLEEGHDCVGVSLLFHPDSTCCRPGDIQDAARVAKALGAEHMVLDARGGFDEHVIKPFVRGYGRGETPNPCPFCNRHIKFGWALSWALGRGFDRVASGHYARLESRGHQVFLSRGRDPSKSQEYFLAMVPPENLARLLLPLGDLPKEEVRRIAALRGLPVHAKPESQDVCFTGGDTPGFLRGRLGTRAGRFLDSRGRLLGRHDGYYAFTVGQRRGHGVATGQRAYVLRIDPPDVILGKRAEVSSRDVELREINRLAPLRERGRYNLRIRYSHPGAEALLMRDEGDRLRFKFSEPQFAIAPGQLGVVYEGDRVLAAGVITGGS